jgi:hypothetical protein
MLILFKFGQKDHLEAFRQLGQMHMRSMRYFASEENANAARGDRFEGASRIMQPKTFEMTINHPAIGTLKVNPADLAGPTIISLNNDAEQNIFCMFSITESSAKPLLDKRHLDFGDSFVLITNTEEFLLRVKRAIIPLKLRAEGRVVEYYDHASYSGKVGPFQKPFSFAYQKEYRIVVSPGVNPSRDLFIGNIADITTPVLPLADLDSIVDFSEEAAVADGVIQK